MKNPKFNLYSKLVILTFAIYLILYYLVFNLSGLEEFDFLGMFFRGMILSLIIPLFNKKFSLYKVKDKKTVSKNRKNLLIFTWSFIAFIVFLALIFYLAIKIIY